MLRMTQQLIDLAKAIRVDTKNDSVLYAADATAEYVTAVEGEVPEECVLVLVTKSAKVQDLVELGLQDIAGQGTVERDPDGAFRIVGVGHGYEDLVLETHPNITQAFGCLHTVLYDIAGDDTIAISSDARDITLTLVVDGKEETFDVDYTTALDAAREQILAAYPSAKTIEVKDGEYSFGTLYQTPEAKSVPAPKLIKLYARYDSCYQDKARFTVAEGTADEKVIEAGKKALLASGFKPNYYKKAAVFFDGPPREAAYPSRRYHQWFTVEEPVVATTQYRVRWWNAQLYKGQPYAEFTVPQGSSDATVDAEARKAADGLTDKGNGPAEILIETRIALGGTTAESRWIKHPRKDEAQTEYSVEAYGFPHTRKTFKLPVGATSSDIDRAATELVEGFPNTVLSVQRIDGTGYTRSVYATKRPKAQDYSVTLFHGSSTYGEDINVSTEDSRNTVVAKAKAYVDKNGLKDLKKIKVSGSNRVPPVNNASLTTEWTFLY